MPNYRYRCTDKSCLKEQDIIHGITDNPEILCECKSLAERIIVSAPTVNFKCGGFYSTGG